MPNHFPRKKRVPGYNRINADDFKEIYDIIPFDDSDPYLNCDLCKKDFKLFANNTGSLKKAFYYVPKINGEFYEENMVKKICCYCHSRCRKPSSCETCKKSYDSRTDLFLHLQLYIDHRQ